VDLFELTDDAKYSCPQMRRKQRHEQISLFMFSRISPQYLLYVFLLADLNRLERLVREGVRMFRHINTENTRKATHMRNPCIFHGISSIDITRYRRLRSRIALSFIFGM
jgi:hypothetical protein